MPTPHPYDAASRENLTHLLENLDSLAELVQEISAANPLTLAVARARLHITIMKGRVHRMIDAASNDAPTGDGIPTPAEALAHMAAAAGLPQPTVLEAPISLEEFQRRSVAEDLAAHLESR